MNDSRVVIGAFGKGRSSSFKLNGILRGLIPHMILGCVSFALVWIETGANPADHPSRFRELPPPLSFPPWLKNLVNLSGSKQFGWEIFAGTGKLTAAHVWMGVAMLPPVELANGLDAMGEWVEDRIRSGDVAWVWLAPPCGSFSPLRNLDRGGPLRPRGCPEGDENVPEVLLGNTLWRRAIYLAEVCYSMGIPFFIEHPLLSKAWQMIETQRLQSKTGVFSEVVHWCMYADVDRRGLPYKKATRLLGSGTWLKGVVRRCDGRHKHGKPLRGLRARAAGAYPSEFCELLAGAYKNHCYGEA